MLDRKTEDWDASVELLEYKSKQSKLLFVLFYFVGALLAMSSVLSTWMHISIAFVGVGLTFVIIATWFLMIFCQYEFYLFLIHKDIIKAVNKRGK